MHACHFVICRSMHLSKQSNYRTVLSTVPHFALFQLYLSPSHLLFLGNRELLDKGHLLPLVGSLDTQGQLMLPMGQETILLSPSMGWRQISFLRSPGCHCFYQKADGNGLPHTPASAGMLSITDIGQVPTGFPLLSPLPERTGFSCDHICFIHAY